MTITPTPILATSTVTTTYVQTHCSIGTVESMIQGPIEVNTYKNNYTAQSIWVEQVEYHATSYITEAPGRCELYQVCIAEVQPNPDISGIGVRKDILDPYCS